MTISQFCKGELSAKLRLPRRRVHVAYCGLEEAFCQSDGDQTAARNDCPEPYVLSVAAAYPHKRLTTLVDAFENLSIDNRSLHLVLAGTYGGKSSALAALRARVAASSASERIHFLPRLATRDLPALYARAEAYVSASEFEGFGIPLIEAMSMGCPIAA